MAKECEGRTAILAVDPVSPFSGGSFLADRVRMGEMDENVYFRSLTSTHFSGGLARGLGRALRVLSAAGFKTVFIETVGSGQDEIEVHTLADTVLVVEAPGLGDDIQALKMGLLEIADIFVVNKKDQPGADSLAGYLEAMLETSRRHCRVCRAVGSKDCGWTPPIVLTSAVSGEGAPELRKSMLRHLKAHKDHAADFEEFRKLSEALEEVDATFHKARNEMLLAGMPPGDSVPEIAAHILTNIVGKLSENM
jgi:LAO/AO transport system kinase